MFFMSLTKLLMEQSFRYHLRSDIDDLFYNLNDDCSQWVGDWVNNDGGWGSL